MTKLLSLKNLLNEEVMASKKKDEIISEASPHTIKKFTLIKEYVESWAYKLLNTHKCNSLVFIDCMCNSGEYIDKEGQQIFGTPVRVSSILAECAKKYPRKEIYLYLNDYSQDKINHLSQLIQYAIPNLHIEMSVKDGNELLKDIASKVTDNDYTSYLLVYDPYDASIDWEAIFPYINHWGEVIINHMLSDSTRAVKVAKREETIRKYENTYLSDIESLIPYGSDKNAYEKRVEEIIGRLHYRNNYYIASFPFFNERNAIVYNLIHCTNSIVGFRLYKQVAWKVFGGKSSTLRTFGEEQQLMFDFDNVGTVTTTAFEDCYYIKDIADYLQQIFNGQQNVLYEVVWGKLDAHPVFPADGFKTEIKKLLKDNHGATIGKSGISFCTIKDKTI